MFPWFARNMAYNTYYMTPAGYGSFDAVVHLHSIIFTPIDSPKYH
jgi:hypothetical protein